MTFPGYNDDGQNDGQEFVELIPVAAPRGHSKVDPGDRRDSRNG